MLCFSSAINRLVDKKSLGATAKKKKKTFYLFGQIQREYTLLTFAEHSGYYESDYKCYFTFHGSY